MKRIKSLAPHVIEFSPVETKPYSKESESQIKERVIECWRKNKYGQYYKAWFFRVYDEKIIVKDGNKSFELFKEQNNT